MNEAGKKGQPKSRVILNVLGYFPPILFIILSVLGNFKAGIITALAFSTILTGATRKTPWSKMGKYGVPTLFSGMRHTDLCFFRIY